jgi:Arc/MetJ-type ribon-helix-helix transcriptional regulator
MVSEHVNVRITGYLRDHLNQQIGSVGLYENASEYIRDLIRRDLKDRQEAWRWLEENLENGLQAEEGSFLKISAEEIITDAKKRHLGHNKG